MKIGILTFHFAYNYGAMLQAYSLSTYIAEKGIDVEIIDYRPAKINYLYRPTLKDVFKHPFEITTNQWKQKRNKTEFICFEEFLTNYFKLGKKDTSYNGVIVGSDQVWNSDITKHDRTYLLADFGNEVKKFSYAASLGKKKHDAEWEKELKCYLDKLDLISVREQHSRDYLEKILPKKEICVAPDPVFLLNRTEWENLGQKTNVPEKYILFYSLGMDKNLQQKAILLSEYEGIPIVNIHPLFPMDIKNAIKKSDIGPREFLWLIRNAQYVCTDSFHAASFSMIFEKDIILNIDEDKGNRISNLLQQLDAVPQKMYDGLQKYRIKDKDKLMQYGRQGEAYLDRIFSLLQDI